MFLEGSVFGWWVVGVVGSPGCVVWGCEVELVGVGVVWCGFWLWWVGDWGAGEWLVASVCWEGVPGGFGVVLVSYVEGGGVHLGEVVVAVSGFGFVVGFAADDDA